MSKQAPVPVQILRAMHAFGFRKLRAELRAHKSRQPPKAATYLGGNLRRVETPTSGAFDNGVSTPAHPAPAAQQTFNVDLAPGAGESLVGQVDPGFFRDEGEAPIQGLWIDWDMSRPSAIFMGHGKSQWSVGRLAEVDANLLAVEANVAGHGRSPILAYMGFFRPRAGGFSLRIIVPNFNRSATS
jgi:hypothetical protein